MASDYIIILREKNAPCENLTTSLFIFDAAWWCEEGRGGGGGGADRCRSLAAEEEEEDV